jgi:archaeal type IV pilus assembly protein PilA
MAVSPVIATVIIVAVAITISVAAGYWISGTSAQYTSVEKLTINSAYCKIDSSVINSKWTIVISLQNTGPTSSRVQYVMVNNALVDEYDVSAGGSLSSTDVIGTSVSSDGLGLESGEQATAYIYIGSDLLSSGTTISVNLQSLAGVNYIVPVKLV